MSGPAAPSGPPQEGHPLRVQTRFERFPASIKGAFVMRGSDGNPHSVRVASARVCRIPSGPEWPVSLEDRLLDVAPNRDLFVPFEVPVAELEPSWYSIRSTIQVDGGRTWEFEGRPFTMPWPRSDVRRGAMAPAHRLTVGGTGAVIERVELGWDAAVVWWSSEDVPTRDGDVDEVTAGPAAGGEPTGPSSGERREPAVGPVLLADGVPLEELPSEAGTRPGELRAPGQRRAVFYPVPKACRSLSAVVRLGSGEESKPLQLRLP